MKSETTEALPAIAADHQFTRSGSMPVVEVLSQKPETLPPHDFAVHNDFQHVLSAIQPARREVLEALPFLNQNPLSGRQGNLPAFKHLAGWYSGSLVIMYAIVDHQLLRFYRLTP